MIDFNKLPRPKLIKYWQLLDDEISFYINELREYQQSMEEALYSKENSFLEKSQHLIAKNQSTEALELLEIELEEMSFRLNSSFPNTFRSGFLIQLIAFVESQLTIICARIKKHNHLKFAVTDLKGSSTFEKAKTYLKKTISIEFASLNPEWKLIMDCKELRNIVVHKNGEFRSDNSKSINDLIANNSSLEKVRPYQNMDDMKMYYFVSFVDGQILENLIDSIDAFFKKIFHFIYTFNQG